jgi:hypothetical protein
MYTTTITITSLIRGNNTHHHSCRHELKNISLNCSGVPVSGAPVFRFPVSKYRGAPVTGKRNNRNSGGILVSGSGSGPLTEIFKNRNVQLGHQHNKISHSPRDTRTANRGHTLEGTGTLFRTPKDAGKKASAAKSQLQQLADLHKKQVTLASKPPHQQ